MMKNFNSSVSMSRSVLLWTKKWADSNQIPNIFLEQTQSTNDDALSIDIPPDELWFLFSSRQSKSRGRNNKKWINSDFMGTWTWRQAKSPYSVLPLWLAWSFYKNAGLIWPGLAWSVKPPNDLYLSGKKILGVLTEISSQSGIFKTVIGVGMNVLKTPSPKWSCLKEYTVIHPRQWIKFMNLLWKDLLWIKQANPRFLEENQKNLLTEAVQKHEDYKEIDQISPCGDLIFKDRIVSWASFK